MVFLPLDRLYFSKGNKTHAPLKFFSKFMNSVALECNLKSNCFSRRMDNYYAWCRLKCLVLLSVSTKSSPMHKDVTIIRKVLLGKNIMGEMVSWV